MANQFCQQAIPPYADTALGGLNTMFASNNDRLALRASNASFDACPFVVRFTKNGRNSELACDDLDHALAVNAQWIQSGAEYVELFRVNEDGSLKVTLGATVQ